MLATARDILALYLGSAILLISVVFIPEVKAIKKLRIFCWIGVLLTSALGTDALIENTIKMERLSNDLNLTKSACEQTTERLKNESATNAVFRQHFDSLISKDPSKVPPEIKQYYQEFKAGSTANFK
jgi:hypothetical protein